MPTRLFDSGVRGVRLPLDPARIGEVAKAAMVCETTVQHYREGRHLLRATEHLITWAIRALSPSPQLDIPMDKPADKANPTARNASEKRGHLAGPVTPVDAVKRRCRVTVVMPEELFHE